MIAGAMSYLLPAQEFSAGFYADVMINADNPNHRVVAHDVFSRSIKTRLEKDDSYWDGLSDLPYIATQYAPDSSFRMITWEIDKADGDFEYYGYFQSKDGTTYSLKKKRGNYGRATTGSIDLATWPAGLVYRIDKLGEAQYLIYTYRQIDKYMRTKTLDVLNLQDHTLGARAFFSSPEDGPLNRLSLSYSADSNASFNYNPVMRMITFDNLIAMPGRMEGQGIAYVSDGTYRAYHLEDNGTWTYQDQLFEANLNQPTDNPRPSDDRNALKKRKRN
jgi:hypothetical protein